MKVIFTGSSVPVASPLGKILINSNETSDESLKNKYKDKDKSIKIKV